MKTFENFNNFKLTDEKFQDFYQSLINIQDSESVQKSLDILMYDVKNNNKRKKG